MRDIVIETADFVDGENKKWELWYFINEHDGGAYGIKIERKSEEERLAEYTLGLSHSYEEVEGWVKMMAARGVTPLALHDVADELVG